jgi:hypothetical protein
MKLRNILSFIIASVFICWVGVFLFIQYKIDSFINKLSPNEVKVSYENLYVLPGITHPVTIIIQNIKATVADGAVLSANIKIHPSFSRALMEISMFVDHGTNHFSIPMIVTAQKSIHKNFYLDTFSINNASINIDDASIEIDGGIKFYRHKMPLGGYNIVINDTPKLLASDLLRKYPKILQKLEKILGKVSDKSLKFRLDYTENGMNLDGVPVENL